MGRARHRPAGRRAGGRGGRFRDQLHRRAVSASDAHHDHARHRPDRARVCQPRALADRRLRQPARHQHRQGARHLPLRSLRLHRLHLLPDPAVRGFPRGAPPRALAVRPRAARHSRELGAHAGDRRGQPGPHPQGLHHRRPHRRHCRRGIDADHADRRARLDQLRALGRRAGDAGARRRRPALRRHHRRSDLHDRTRSVLRHRAAILVFLDRSACWSAS